VIVVTTNAGLQDVEDILKWIADWFPTSSEWFVESKGCSSWPTPFTHYVFMKTHPWFMQDVLLDACWLGVSHSLI